MLRSRGQGHEREAPVGAQDPPAVRDEQGQALRRDLAFEQGEGRDLALAIAIHQRRHPRIQQFGSATNRASPPLSVVSGTV